MKIAVTAAGPTLETHVDPRFGRCPYFLIVNTEDLSVEVIENPSVRSGSGAGVQSAQIIADKGVEYVLTGNCGPNAYHTLSAAHIGVVAGCRGLVREAVEGFCSSPPTTIDRPSVASHFGMTGSTGMGRSPKALTLARVDQESCCGCGVCLDVCPVNAISLRQGVAFIDPELCIACGACTRECPTGSIRLG